MDRGWAALVTGGAGFIGSHFVKHLLRRYPEGRVVVLDKLTYAGNQDNLRDVQSDPRLTFVKGDICHEELVNDLVGETHVVFNFAAETHVDRSIDDPEAFIRTNMVGTYVLLEAARRSGLRFIQISTDEVYGSTVDGSFRETDPLKPSSPYSASKASGDLLALSYYVTYGLPTIVVRSTNNFGSHQFPEKLIPLFVTNALQGKNLPVYGDGLNIRDWLYVADNCDAIDFLWRRGKEGQVYNVGGGNEKTNLEITHLILKLTGSSESLVEFVDDRLGHDRRYSLDCNKLRELGWSPSHDFEVAMGETVAWYVDHREWWQRRRGGE